jgi:predicted Rossmann fold flavoprotein
MLLLRRGKPDASPQSRSGSPFGTIEDVPQPHVLVIGAGAAGIIAAWNAARLGARVTLLEKTTRLGTKILISGGGKCNIAHDGPMEDVLRAFRPNEARFIRPACYRFPNVAIVKMLTDRGLEVYTREDGRIFPVRQTAKDVVAILKSYLDDERVEVRLETPVHAVRRDEEGVCAVVVDSEQIPCRRVVLAVGGASYPSSGTTGDGYPWALALGHSLVPVKAALSPISMEIEGMDPRAGVAVRDKVLKARLRGKAFARWRHDLLFTHRGVSGPTVLGISREVAERQHEGPIELELDLAPDHSFETLTEWIKQWQAANPRRLLGGMLEEFVPRRLVPDLMAAAEIEPTMPASKLGQKARNRVVEVLKGWRLGKVREAIFEKGEVVAGGVALDEVDPQTMASLRCPGLYLCGEVLDVAGPVGGYNLQAAFATGFVAGESAARQQALPMPD